MFVRAPDLSTKGILFCPNAMFSSNSLICSVYYPRMEQSLPASLGSLFVVAPITVRLLEMIAVPRVDLPLEGGTSR
jgi:hypothetical protein